MNTAKENLILHPVRLRILIAVAGRQVTAQQLADELPDIPQASLYRNIKTLADGGMLVVVKERRVHNTVEKTFALPEQGTLLTPEDLKNASPEDYRQLFTQFLGQQLGYFARYIQKGDVDLVRDHLFFQMYPFYLNETELQQFGQALNAVLLPTLENEPGPDRRRYILGLTNIPDVANAQRPSPSENTAPALDATKISD